MPLDNDEIKKRSESFGDYVFNLMKKDIKFEGMGYGELMLAVDHMYAQIAHNIFTEYKKSQ